MALEPLPFDQMEVEKSMVPGALLPCPFCGGTRMLMSSGVNKATLSGRVLYQSRITCQNYHCNASVLQNTASRDESQRRVIEQWERRAMLDAAPQATAEDSSVVGDAVAVPEPHPYAGKRKGHPDGDFSYRCGSDYCRCAQ